MATKRLAFLTYEFLFDPAETFQHVFQFEQAFAKFLSDHGMEGQFVESINPKEDRRILYIRRALKPGVMGKSEDKQSTVPQDVIKKYIDPNTYKDKEKV